jgi:hypothetical protein
MFNPKVQLPEYHDTIQAEAGAHNMWRLHLSGKDHNDNNNHRGANHVVSDESNKQQL